MNYVSLACCSSCLRLVITEIRACHERFFVLSRLEVSQNQSSSQAQESRFRFTRSCLDCSLVYSQALRMILRGRIPIELVMQVFLSFCVAIHLEIKLQLLGVVEKHGAVQWSEKRLCYSDSYYIL